MDSDKKAEIAMLEGVFFEAARRCDRQVTAWLNGAKYGKFVGQMAWYVENTFVFEVEGVTFCGGLKV